MRIFFSDNPLCHLPSIEVAISNSITKSVQDLINKTNLFERDLLAWFEENPHRHPLYQALEKGNKEIVQIVYENAKTNTKSEVIDVNDLHAQLVHAIVEGSAHKFVIVFSLGFYMQKAEEVAELIALATEHQREKFISYLTLLS